MASNKGVEEVKTMKTREVKFKVTRHEWWFPVYEVPAHLTDEEALELVQEERPDEVYDEYHNQDTYDQDCWSELKTDGAYQVTGKYRTHHNQFGVGTLNDFHLEVRADDIESARKIAVDKITSDGRRHVDSVCDIEISLHKEAQEEAA
jgi:hypothetical protein